MYYICQLKVEDLNHVKHVNHANVEEEVSLAALKTALTSIFIIQITKKSTKKSCS